MLVPYDIVIIHKWDIRYCKHLEAWMFENMDEKMSILIKDTTKEEREKIVSESIGNTSGACDGCMAGLADMYQDYIDGKREIRDINMAFRTGYESGIEGPERADCGYYQR